MMKARLFLLCLTVVACLPAVATAKTVAMSSPDGKNTVVIETERQVTYTLRRHGRTLLDACPLSLTVGDDTWGRGETCLRVRHKSVAEPVTFGVPRKYATAVDRYRQLTLHYRDHAIEFRLYDDGLAYRFVSTTDHPSPVRDECVSYRFAHDPATRTLLTDQLQNWFEQDYTVRPLSALPCDSFSVAPVMAVTDGVRLLLSEANLYDYPGLYLRPDTTAFRGLFAAYPAEEAPYEGDNKRYVTSRCPYLVPRCGERAFPWRVAGTFDDDASILGSELIYLLSDPQDAAADYSWVRPGKVLWDWWNDRNLYHVGFASGINTATYLYLVDYAALHGIEYVLIDEGWSARNDLLTLAPDVDIPLICRRAAQKGVGIQLWAKWVNVDRQMEEAFAQFARWGVAGVKIDFMDRNDARMVHFYEQVARAATRHRLLVDFHGSYPCEGMRRRYPNLMTREGVIGLEYNKWSRRATVTHDVTIPFLRMWAGPMDYTPGAMLNAHPETFYDNQHEPMSQGTRSHQVAMYVVYESPLQMLSDSPTKYDENADSFHFLRDIPTVWDETVPLCGEVGEYVAVARRRGDVWYVGVLNGATPRRLQLDLSFIGTDLHRIDEHADGPNAHQQAKDRTVTGREFTATAPLVVDLARGGGYAAIIRTR